MKDLFISHASEDKDSLVRSLAEKLKRAGVDVWFDEYSIEPGDSISASIDKGLIECNYGLIILSPAFLEKKWTDYELKSLLTKEVNQGKTIIPIWYNVDFDIVSKRSLYLADKKALSPSEGINKLIFEIIKIVRPDVLSSFLLKLIDKKIKKNGQTEYHDISDLKLGPIQHKSLPKHLVLAAKMIDSAFPGISTHSEIVRNFARDYDYDGEYMLWCLITSAYWDSVYAMKYLPDEKEMKERLHFLIRLSMGDTDSLNKFNLSDEVKVQLGNSYLNNADLLFPILDNERTTLQLD